MSVTVTANSELGRKQAARLRQQADNIDKLVDIATAFANSIGPEAEMGTIKSDGAACYCFVCGRQVWVRADGTWYITGDGLGGGRQQTIDAFATSGEKR